MAPTRRSSRQSAAREATEAASAVANHTISNIRMSRSRRAAAQESMASVSRESPSSPSQNPSMRLTVKMGQGRLSSGGRRNQTSAPASSLSRRENFVGGEILEGKRARNVKKSYVVESSEDDDDDDEDMADVGDDDEDAEGESIEDLDDDVDAEAEEDEDAEGDEDEMDVDSPRPPPTIKISRAGASKQTAPVSKSAAPAAVTPADDSDDELSELDSDIGEGLGGEDDAEGEEEDAEGEEEEIEVEVDDEEEVEVEEDDDLGLSSDDEVMGSRGSTPDVSRMTKRQRAMLEEGDSGHLMALPDEVQVKKHLTAEEHAMRRAEMARRRKNLSEKRNEEEKMETINKLLKKQAPKTSTRRSNLATEVGVAETSEVPRPDPLFVRWISNKDGNKMAVPEEWIDAPVGSVFKNSLKGAKENVIMGSQLVVEVE